MESLQSNEVLKFPPNALQEIRKLYDLDKPGVMADAVDILQEWIKQQNHFLNKDFDRSYLERIIIGNKGSVERAKQRLDKVCTSRTLLSSLFVNCRVKDLTGLDVLEDALLPRATKDHYRIYLLRNRGQEFDSQFFVNYYIRLLHILEYVYANDYAAGVLVVFDYRQLNIMGMAKKMDLVLLQQVMSVLMDCYGLRVKGIHILSASKVIDALVSVFKQVFSAKVGSRIHVHKTLDLLHEHIDKDLLPAEYGGNEKSLTEIHKINVEALSSDKNMEYMKKMNAAGTNELYRQTDKFNEQCLDMAGTFRTLSVD